MIRRGGASLNKYDVVALDVFHGLLGRQDLREFIGDGMERFGGVVPKQTTLRPKKVSLRVADPSTEGHN